MSRATTTTAKRSRRAASDPYLARAIQPLQSLVFLLPLIVLYEIGTRLLASDPAHHTEQRIIAFNLMQDFFHLFGAYGRYLPAMAVVGILLTWHIARNDPWKVQGRTLGLMAVESVAFALPLLLLGFTLARYLQLRAGWGNSVVLSLGAGIYEELVFRLIAFTALHFLLRDWLKLPVLYAYLGMVGTSAILFALYHYLGSESFQWRSFVFRTLAGIYFGVLFLTRGFGVTAGCHASYDILVSTLHVLVP